MDLNSAVADERALELGSALGLVGTLSLAEGLGQALGSSPARLTTSMCVRVRVRELRRALGFCDEYLEAGAPFEDLSSIVALVDGFKFGRLTPLDASVRLRVSRDVPEAFILSARAPRRVRPGQRVRIRLSLQRRRSGRTALSFPFRVPRSLRPGVRTLTLRGIVPASLREGSEEGLEELFRELEELDAAERRGTAVTGRPAAPDIEPRQARRAARYVRLARAGADSCSAPRAC